MICDGLSELIGVACTPMDDEGRIALIETPFRFADGDAMPLFAEDAGPQVRFFDDGGAVWHLLGRGVRMDDARRTLFLKRIAERHAVTFTDAGELEVWASRHEAPQGFARIVTALLAVGSWERENEGIALDTAALLDEVAGALARWRPQTLLRRDVPLSGISRQVHHIDFALGHEMVLAIRPHPAAVSSAIRKLLDVKNLPANHDYTFRVVLDDRQDKEGARREGAVLSTVANVTVMSALLRQSAQQQVH